MRIGTTTLENCLAVPIKAEHICPVCVCVCVCVCVVALSYPTLCDPMNCSPPGSSVHRIFQARIQEWVAISFSRASSGPRGWTGVSCIFGRCFTIWASREGQTHMPYEPAINSMPRYTLTRNASTCVPEDAPKSIYSTATHNSPQTETCHVLISSRMENTTSPHEIHIAVSSPHGICIAMRVDDL